MDKVAFPYRSSSHLVFLHVVAESGAWEKHGLEVVYDRQISSTEAHRAVPLGEVEFVGGNLCECGFDPGAQIDLARRDDDDAVVTNRDP